MPKPVTDPATEPQYRANVQSVIDQITQLRLRGNDQYEVADATLGVNDDPLIVAEEAMRFFADSIDSDGDVPRPRSSLFYLASEILRGTIHDTGNDDRGDFMNVLGFLSGEVAW